MKKRLIKKTIAAAIAALSCVFVASASGCASLRAAAERRSRIHAKVENHVYSQPASRVWADARALLFELGYEVANAEDTQATTLETYWKHDGNWRSRYLVQAIPSPAGTQIQFIESKGFLDSDANAKRNVDVEWRLLKRLDPTAAAEIEAYASMDGTLDGGPAPSSDRSQPEGGVRR